MACCKNGIFSPWVKDCEGELRTIRSSEALRVGGQIVPMPILIEDLDLYLSVSGNDDSGLGTSDKPFYSIHRAHEEILKYNPGNYQINIHVGKGVFIMEDGFSPSWLWGGKVFIEGEFDIAATDVAGRKCAVSNIDGSHSTDGDYSELQYFDFDFTLNAYWIPDIAIGHFIFIREVSGGTYPDAIRGMHKIIGWNASTKVATVRVWQRVGVAEIPSGSIDITWALNLQSVFKLKDGVEEHGITVNGSHAGNWKYMMVEGNKASFLTKRGILVTGGGTFATNGGYVGVHEWSWGLYNSGSLMEYSLGFVSKIRLYGVVVAGGTQRMGWGSYVTGCGERGWWITDNSRVEAWDSITIASSKFWLAYAEDLSDINFYNSDFYYEDAINYTSTLAAVSWSRIFNSSATFTGFTDNNYTATNGEIYPAT